MQGVITLKEIVGWFLDGHNYSSSEYRKAYAIAIRGWRKLNWDMTGKISTVTLEVDCDLTACLPKGFIKETKIGVINNYGEIATLTQNNQIAFDTKASCDYVADFPLPIAHKGVNTILNTRSYGLGSHTSIGEYRINKGEGKIYFNPNFCYSEVVLEFIGHPTVDGEYCIHEFASEALLSFIRWQWAVNDRQIGLAEKNQLKRQWISDKADAKYRIKKPTISEMNQLSRTSVKMGIKG